MSYYVVFCTDRPGTSELRQERRPPHREHIRTPGDDGARVVLAGPTLADDGETMNGTMMIIDAPSKASAEKLFHADPYVKAGLFEEITIRPWTCGLGSIGEN